jgi:hypothetical protein
MSPNQKPNMNPQEISKLVFETIKKLYIIDGELFERDLCERCLVHRLAVHLGSDTRLSDYIVDCEFNKAYTSNENSAKRLSSTNGNYVDIIIHKRGNPIGSNLACIEVKKRNNYDKQAIEKDRTNLRMLTSLPYCYTLGLYIYLGKTYTETKVQSCINGVLSQEMSLMALMMKEGMEKERDSSIFNL